MIREIVTPTENTYVLRLPDEFIGKSVEVLAFPLTETNPPSETPNETDISARMERLKKSLEGYTFNSGGYKFNREEANDYD